MTDTDHDTEPVRRTCQKRPAECAVADDLPHVPPLDEGDAPRRRRRKQQRHQSTPAHELRSAIQNCCKHNDLGQALQLYQNAVRQRIPIHVTVYYSVLALCDGVQPPQQAHPQQQHPSAVVLASPKDTTDTTATPSAICETAVTAAPDTTTTTSPANTTTPSNDTAPALSWHERKRQALQIKEAMDAAHIPLNEASYTALIKVCLKTDDVAAAQAWLEESERVQQCKPKLRLYAALLQAYAQRQQPVQALQIWIKLVQQQLHITERDYLALIRCAVHVGSPVLLQGLLTDLAQDVPVPTTETSAAIQQWFASEAATTTTTTTATHESTLQQLLDQLHAAQYNPRMRSVAPTMGPVQSATGWHISPSCPIDTSTGTLTAGCLVGERLGPVVLAPETWHDLHTVSHTIGMTGQLAQHESAFRGGGKGTKRLPVNPQQRQKQWQGFLRYLEQRPAVQVVIDGANVGHHQPPGIRLAPAGQLSYEPIEWVVRTLQRDYGKTSVLVVMHSRHFGRDKVPRHNRAMVDQWFHERLVYKTPPGMDDDIFWMHVALSRPGTLVVTNDEMRDHHFQMLAPRCFLRWKDRHQVKFTFGPSSAATTTPRRPEVLLTFPEVYTRRIQRVADGLVIPLPPRGEGVSPAVPSSHADDPDVETYLCIRPK